MQEKTVREERALVHGMLWNGQESGQKLQPQRQPAPEKGKQTLPGQPRASECAAKRLHRSLVTGH